jgi:hypothetical protein
MVEDRTPVKASGGGNTMPFAGIAWLVGPGAAAHRSSEE